MLNRLTLVRLGATLFVCLPAVAETTVIRPGAIWTDTGKAPINAHGGGMLYHDGVYHWYGEDKSDGQRRTAGVRVYTSRDLLNWDDGGLVLTVSDDAQSEITRGCIIERPKVLFNQRTGQFVMWFHLELKGHRYNAARAGWALSQTPTGPFAYQGSVRPNAGRFPIDISEPLRQRVLTRDRDRDAGAAKTNAERADRAFVRDFYGGQMARDMTLFLDDDGTAYHIFAAEENYTLHIAELDETFTRHTGRYLRLNPGGHREAPAIFKRNNRYHLITSGCSGWKPNAAQHAVADSIWGPWVVTGNPAAGAGREVTFDSQSTFVLPVVGQEDAFIFMADRWNARNLADSRYVWLPIEFEGDRPVLRFRETWDPRKQWEH